MTQKTRFDGFPTGLPRFFAQLEKNNNKRWFDQHRKDYEELYVEPAKAFVGAIAPGLGRISEDLRAEPRINGSIMRINRDTRFSKDKTPYKNGLHFLFPEGGGPFSQCPGFYIRIDAKELRFAAGLFAMTPEQLGFYRRAVADGKSGTALRRAIAAVRKVGATLEGQHYKRVPRGYDPDHPNAELLKHNGLYAAMGGKHPSEMFTADAVGYCLETFRRLRPVEKWLADNVGA